MPELKIGIQLRALRQPLGRAIQTASRLGASAVEIDARRELNVREMSETGVRQLKKMLDDANVGVCALEFQTRRGYNVPERLQERVEATKAAMNLAWKLGARVLVNQVGHIPEDTDTSEWNLLIDVLGELGKHAHRCGVFLAAETGGEDPASLLKLIDALPEGSIGITLNPGNLIIHGFSASAAVNELGQHIMYVRAKDGVRDLAQGRGLEVPLGRGSADFPELIGLLEEFGYRGYFTVARENATDPINEISMAVEYLSNI